MANVVIREQALLPDLETMTVRLLSPSGAQLVAATAMAVVTEGSNDYAATIALPDGITQFVLEFDDGQDEENSVWTRDYLYLPGLAEAQQTDLTYIKTKVAALSGAGEVRFTTPVLESGNLQLVPGMDYYYADGVVIEYELSSWPVLTGGSGNLVIPSLDISAPVEVIAARRIRIPVITAEQTALLQANTNPVMRVDFVLASGNAVRLLEGNVEVDA